MKRSRRLNAVALLVILVAVWPAPSARAQSPCSHVDIQLDTGQSVDADAICQASRPWADEGIHIFIYLTDRRPNNEDDWFALLDQVEAKAGLRDLSQPDSFNKNALAIEASTATDLNWAYSITYGELLYNTPLDTDEAVSVRIKSRLREAIAAGDPTSAFVEAVTAIYDLNHPPPVSQTDQRLPTPVLAQSPPPVQAESKSSLPWGWILAGIAAVGVAVVAGYLLTVKVIQPTIKGARHRSRLKRHLEMLRMRIANLLNACDQILQGDAPEDTVLFQLFSAYGGEHYKDLRTDVKEWLRRCQGALDDAFDLRQKLLDPAVQKERTLEQTIHDWEMLYVTFVGSSERILALSDDELRTLLDPLLTLEHPAPDVQLTKQLDDLRRELAGGMPLKAELTMVDPTQIDTEGILGYIDQVKSQISRMLAAREEAPQHLAEAENLRQTTEEHLPDPFAMTEKQLFAAIDQRLAQASTDLEQRVFLRVIERADDIVRDLGTIQRFFTVAANHERRQTDIKTVTDLGYRPDGLADALKEIAGDLESIAKEIEAGDYLAAATWIEELDTDSQRALTDAQMWQALHEANSSALRQIGDTLARMEAYHIDKSTPAAETLQTYPASNWSDVADGLDQARQLLLNCRKESIPQIERLNSMEQQAFVEAEEKLARASVDLAQAERQLQAVVHRLDEVKAAQANIEEALRLTESDLAQSEALRNEEDVKIGPEIDQQIKLAHEHLRMARQLAKAREFITATNEQVTARELATGAYAAAIEQVHEINALQTELEILVDSVSSQVGHCRAAAEALPAVVQTAATNGLVNQVATAFSKAQQTRSSTTGLQDHALADALRGALAAYQETDKLCDQALQRIATDRDAYDRALTEARDSVHRAQAAIQRAQWVVKDPDAHNAGQRALQRAQKTMSHIGSPDNATRETLGRISAKAQQALQDAQQAERLASQEIRATEAARRRHRQRTSWSASGSFGSSSSSRPSSSTSSSRRSSSRGSSRRSSARGSSRRSSSRGSSRRK